MAKIAAKVTGGEAVEVEYYIPDDLDGLVDHFGPEVVYSKAVDALTIDVQAFVRRHLKGSEKVAPKAAHEIQSLVEAYKPGAGHPKKSASDRALDLISKMSAEDKAALLASLRG